MTLILSWACANLACQRCQDKNNRKMAQNDIIYFIQTEAARRPHFFDSACYNIYFL